MTTAQPGGPDDAIERSGLLAWPYHPIVGVDEVGRGPLAGPVVAAAVALDPERVPQGLNDSKTLDRTTRERLANETTASAHAVAVASLPARTIDRLNIRGATLEAMRQAVLALAITPARILVDGRDGVLGVAVPCEAIVKGDMRSVSIAAASIVAKVSRDRMMASADSAWPRYGFAQHVGYPTPTHRRALEEHGLSPIHRRSFGTVRRLLERDHEGTDPGARP